MLAALWKTIFCRRWLTCMTIGFIFSSIGSGLTFIIVFGELIRLHASASSLAIAYILSTAPGLLGSQLGERLKNYVSPFLILITGELIGLIGLGFPLWGIKTNSVPLLQLTECFASLSYGMTLPALNLLFKRSLSDSELPAAASYETLTFASNVLCGVGVGVLLFGKISSTNILLLDGISYILSIGLIWLGWHFFQGNATPDTRSKHTGKLTLTGMSKLQKRGFVLLPLLAIVASPAMVLLPMLYSIPGNEFALPLLFSRSLGQLFGPLVLPAERFGPYSRDNRILFISLCIFVICYFFVTKSTHLWQALILIFTAHVFSNMIFSLAWYSLLAHFDEEHVASASARAYRLQVITISTVSIAVGILADISNAFTVFYILSGGGLFIAGLFILLDHQRNSAT